MRLNLSLLLIVGVFTPSVALGTEIPFGNHGIVVTVPAWEYSEIRLAHYNKDDYNLDLSIYTNTLSDRADKGEGILIRFSPTIDTYHEHISEDKDILKEISGGGKQYVKWKLDKKGEQFELSTLLQDKRANQIWEFKISSGKWHSLNRYYRTKNGIYAIYVWDVNGNPQNNKRIVRAFHLIRRSAVQEGQEVKNETSYRKKAQRLFAKGEFDEGYDNAKKAMQLYLKKDQGPPWMLIEKIDLKDLRIHVHLNMGYDERKPPEIGIIRPLSFWVWSKREHVCLLEKLDFEIGIVNGKAASAALGKTKGRSHENFGTLDIDTRYQDIRKKAVELIEGRH